MQQNIAAGNTMRDDVVDVNQIEAALVPEPEPFYHHKDGGTLSHNFIRFYSRPSA